MTEGITTALLERGILGLMLLICFSVIVVFWRKDVAREERHRREIQKASEQRVEDWRLHAAELSTNTDVLRELSTVIVAQTDKTNNEIRNLEREIRELRGVLRQ